MKKTLSILAVAALGVGAAMTTAAKDVVIEADRSNSTGTAYGSLATGATLVDTYTGKIVIYDESDDIDVIKAPFQIEEGTAATGVAVSLKDIASYDWQEGDRLVIDFTQVGYGYQAWGDYITAGYETYNYTTGEYDDYDYLRISIVGFGEWYEKNGPVEMVGRFKTSNGSSIETTAFYVADACDANDLGDPTSLASLMFFSEDVIEDVRNAEVPAPSPSVPEPTTATLSLLALAGLAARRRRR